MENEQAMFPFTLEWEEVFLSWHKDDDRYKKHCVDCGKLLYRYEACWDGHRNERGDLIEQHDAVRILDGLRCLDCAAIFKEALLKAYVEFQIVNGEKDARN